MEKISFHKFTGAGNDFILIDGKDFPDSGLTSGRIRSLCDRRYGIGADGVLVVRNHTGYNFEMEYYNSDGSTGSLCGNGARCAIKYAGSAGMLNEGKGDFICNGIEYRGEIFENGNVRFYMNEVSGVQKGVKVNTGGYEVTGYKLDTGSPHFVVFVKDIRKNGHGFNDINDIPVRELGKLLRNDEIFQPDGVNVNFVSGEKNRMYIRTYERGVENETLACGTGATASAIAAVMETGMKPPVSLITRGGDILTVEFRLDNMIFENVTLTGPAVNVFNGEIFIN